ncbi:MAG: tryptophan synthase subunit alpha [Dehalococcoidia bacterium]|nr:tryptophan synthase subunit alpha [Dehalococcoidia bacterium]
MSRISAVFTKHKRKALIAYITVGYPDTDATLKAARILEEAGCDIIELGIPFSDPLADGVTIQNATHHALLNGVTVAKCLETAAQIRSSVKTPLAFMGYLNPVLHYGPAKFCADCTAAGVDGLIIPDLPPGELPLLDEAASKNGVDMICFLAPNSSDERISEIAGRARGFIYVVSVTGVTGVREGFSSGLQGFISRVRNVTELPLCIGFGISGPEQARQAARLADGIIIGSRIIQLMEEDGKSYRKLHSFIKEIRGTLDNSQHSL